MKKLSPGIRAWLDHLATVGAAHRPKTNVGYRAMQAGYAEWLMVGPDGQQLTWTAFNERFQPGEERVSAWEEWSSNGEVLTEAGCAALAADHG